MSAPVFQLSCRFLGGLHRLRKSADDTLANQCQELAALETILQVQAETQRHQRTALHAACEAEARCVLFTTHMACTC